MKQARDRRPGNWTAFPGRPARSASGRAIASVNPVPKPFLVMNPRSGGGKVAAFGLAEKARAMGADVVVLTGSDIVDLTMLARDAVTRGANLLGVAGGDGMQAAVAAVAAEHDLPFLVLSAGTANRFALDLGLDPDDPVGGLAALRDSVEIRVDLGIIGGRTFVNDVSFGDCPRMVEDPADGADHRPTAPERLPGFVGGDRGAQLMVDVADVRLDRPQAILVSNNPYGWTEPDGLGRRSGLHDGVLGVMSISVPNAWSAMAGSGRRTQPGTVRLTGTEVIVHADQARIPVCMDGEAIVMRTPVRCSILPGALRVWVPRGRQRGRSVARTTLIRD